MQHERMSMLRAQVIQADKPFLVCGKPDIGTKEEQAVLAVLRSGWLGNGPYAQQFEQEFSAYLGIENAVAVSSCTMGLILALRAAGVGSGDEVVTTPLTFAATVNAILALGAKPVFVDVDETGSMDALQVKNALTKKTKAILPVHLWGVPCDMWELNTIAQHNQLQLIEDAAHGFGGYYLGDDDFPLGTLGDYGVFSFYPTKNITAGDGGMVVTKDKAKAERIRALASQGLTSGAWMRYADGPIKEYEVSVDGYKGLMPDLLAAVGLAQLRRWPELRKNRNEVFKTYEKEFGKQAEGHSQHIFEIRVENRTEMRMKLHANGIGTGVHYNPLHLEPGYAFLGQKKGDFVVAEHIGARTMSLPLSSTMTEDDAFRVIEAVNKIKGA